ncbi:MAG: hypothetical protein ACXAC7_11830 [Candidatus Hodarchaeales archaeon]|jgi:hypothetical protein
MHESTFTVNYKEFQKIITYKDIFTYNKEKQILTLHKPELKFNCTIKPPIIYEIFNFFSIDNEEKNLPQPFPEYLILLIRAGNAALGIYQQENFTYHKKITKYMVRKKQGKAQLTYLAHKGKTRGGGKLRLKRSREFFEEIIEKLLDWKPSLQETPLILYQCPPRLWGELFRSKILPPFEKNDQRIQKIPLTTGNPNFKELQRVNWLLLNAQIKVQSLRNFISIKSIFNYIMEKNELEITNI